MKITKTVTYNEEELNIIQTALMEYAQSYKDMFKENPEDFDEVEVNAIYAHISTLADDFDLPGLDGTVSLRITSGDYYSEDK